MIPEERNNPFDIIAAVERQRQTDNLRRREARAADVELLRLMQAIVAVEDATIRKEFEQRDTTAIGHIGATDTHALIGRANPLEAPT